MESYHQSNLDRRGLYYLLRSRLPVGSNPRYRLYINRTNSRGVTMDKPISEVETDPFEEFVDRCVEFDEQGRSKLQSRHGLAKLLKRFYEEAIKTELDQFILDQAIKESRLLDLEAKQKEHAHLNQELSFWKGRAKEMETLREETIRKAAEIVRTHLLTDWSGESEVYEQLEEIAVKIESMHSPKK